jgi:hypothetical protein
MKPIALPGLALILALTPPLTVAQQSPLTGRMMDGNTGAMRTVPTSSAPPAASTPAKAALGNSAASPAASVPTSASPSGAALTLAERSEYEEPEPAQIGDTVRQLFQMQASDQRPGQRLPVLGDEASASYRRYLKSFEHEIPDFYETKVAGNGANANSGD